MTANLIVISERHFTLSFFLCFGFSFVYGQNCNEVFNN